MYGICGLVAALALIADALHNELGGLVILMFCVSAWIGVQHLGYTEFATARQLFLKGTFRRIIDTETTIQEFERALTATRGFDELWKVLIHHARSLDFRRVRLSLHGQVFEEQFGQTDNVNLWQIRVSLGAVDYVEFERAVTSESLPYLANFIRIVRHRLTLETTADIAAGQLTMQALSTHA
jgi:hypothetical protein